MASLRAGEVSALDELFERHHRPMYGFFRGQSGREDLAEDLVQDLFLRILRYRRSYEPGRRFLPWMLGIARNLLADAREAGRFVNVEAAEALAAAETPETDYERGEERRRVLRALAALPADARELLLLSHVRELRYREIAEMLAIREGAVKVRVHRALARLRELVHADDPDAERES